MNYYLYKLKNIALRSYWDVAFKLHPVNENLNAKDISIIVVGRNDNYGGDFSLRLKNTIDWNLKQLPEAELIYVEWNKIPEKESDCNWIEERYPNAKCFTISNEVHQTITQNPKMPVMEYFAKNIGMRKASRQWLLMINADCMLGNDVRDNLKRLNKNYVYGTHYLSFKWDGKPINKEHFTNKQNYTVVYSASLNIDGVVGNFILTHKSNWIKASGYDENLKNSRAGVDTNGLNQLFYLGLKPMVIGTHYHLDHPESMVYGKNDSHGNNQFNNIPYKNNENWGFSNKSFKQISDRIWQLEKI